MDHQVQPGSPSLSDRLSQVAPLSLGNFEIYGFTVKFCDHFKFGICGFMFFVYLINDRSVGESHLTIKLLGTVLISISELAMATAKCSDFREPAYNACTSVSHQSM